MPEGADMRKRWPRFAFELVIFSEPTGIPHHWDEALLRLGAPKSLLGIYKAASELTLVERPSCGTLVRFGSVGDRSICLDPRTGMILDVMDMYDDIINLVNSSLEQFIASVRAVIDRFPFDSEYGDPDIYDAQAEELKRHTPTDEWTNADWDHWEQRDEKYERETHRAYDELTETLQRIDSAALAGEGTFWNDFLDSLVMGDLSTKYYLEEIGHKSQEQETAR